MGVGGFLLGFVAPAVGSIGAIVALEFGDDIAKAAVTVARKGKVLVVRSAKAAAKIVEKMPPGLKKVKLRAIKSEIAFFVALETTKLVTGGDELDIAFGLAKAGVGRAAGFFDPRGKTGSARAEANLALSVLALTAFVAILVVGTLAVAGFGGTVPLLGIGIEIALADAAFG